MRRWLHGVEAVATACAKRLENRKKGMLCPYCLEEVEFQWQQGRGRDGGGLGEIGGTAALRHGDEGGYRCPAHQCGERVPSMYVRDYEACPPTVASCVGFSRHGKSVFLASLFYLFRHVLSRVWPGFHTLLLDGESLETVLNSLRDLEHGALPGLTPRVFPRPTLMQIRNVPETPDCTLCIYDTSGEALPSPADVGRYARFVARAPMVFFLVSLADLAEAAPAGVDGAGPQERIAQRMFGLLHTYTEALTHRLGGDPHSQDLVVVFTKSDLLTDYLADSRQLREYASGDGLEELRNVTAYIEQVRAVSSQLEQMTREGLGATAFVESARARFRSVQFCIVSALGSAPDQQTNRLAEGLRPQRCIDPLLLLLGGPSALKEAEAPLWERWLSRLSGRLKP